jgi:predicted Zn-dependent protease
LSAVELAARALRAAEGDEAEAFVHSERSGLARFAGSVQHQPTLIEDEIVTLRVVRDGRVGVAVSNRTSDEGLRTLAARARDAADNAPVDSEFPGLAPPGELPEVDGFDDETAAMTEDDYAGAASRAISHARGLDAYGFFTSGVTELAVASTAGMEASQRLTDATLVVLGAGDGVSGYATRTAWRVGEIDVEECAQEAAERGARTRGAGELEPAAYRAVLEPYAIAELLQYFGYDSLGALGFLEERSYFSGRLGELCFDERVSLTDDALDPRGLPKAFDFEGSAKERVPLIENGVIRGVVWDRRTAKRAGGDARGTGHAPPVAWQSYGPLPFALSLAGGDAESVDELVERVEDGIYVTRLHYLGVVHPRQGVITGMTRDGTFRVRDGKIAEPLVNLRFTVSLPHLLRELLGLTREVTLVNGSDFYGERYPNGTLVPAVATTYFNVTGVGSTPGI